MEYWLARYVIANASLVITHSETARNLVMREFSMDNKHPIVVVPHGNYTESYDNTVSAENARKHLELDGGSVIFLFFGNIRPYKGVPELIEAYQRLQSSSHSLVIAGRPLNDNTLFDIKRRIENNKRIQLREGFIPDEDVQVYMNASDVVVFPYQDILTSGAIILAMSFGRACIAPALGCIPDVLDDRGAFLYDPSVPDGLRNAMQKAVHSRALLKQMGEWNRTRAAEWNWGRIAERTADIYDEVTGNRNSRHRTGPSVWY
jgi:glycosyltransferase involved in cell wall biosynthesis